MQETQTDIITYLDAWVPRQRTPQPHEGATDLVADGGVALGVLDALAATEEVAAARARGGGGVVVHFQCTVSGLRRFAAFGLLSELKDSFHWC